ncbi:SH2 domain-containing protein 1B-like [Huso huso]|uniref:SH2 domain-containing protein 1B-like n=1 Tax=Huso huso TaxID=61971 RepID=A0ABR0ZNG8_HUSHU
MDSPVYHGNIDKKTCEELMLKKEKDGSYLLRDSETIAGAFCLCVYLKKVIYTYRILMDHRGYYTLQTAGGVEEKFFPNLKDLIANYKRRGQGLATPLRHPVKKTEPAGVYQNVREEKTDYRAGISMSCWSKPAGNRRERRREKQEAASTRDDADEYEEIQDEDYVVVLPS